MTSNDPSHNHAYVGTINLLIPEIDSSTLSSSETGNHQYLKTWISKQPNQIANADIVFLNRKVQGTRSASETVILAELEQSGARLARRLKNSDRLLQLLKTCYGAGQLFLSTTVKMIDRSVVDLDRLEDCDMRQVWVGHSLPLVAVPGFHLAIQVSLNADFTPNHDTLNIELLALLDLLIPRSGDSSIESGLLAKEVEAIRDLFKRCIPAKYPVAESASFLQPQDLLPTLLPYQRRAVGWMLSREQSPLVPLSATETASSASSSSNASAPLPLYYEKRVNDCGDDVYLNVLSGHIAKSPAETVKVHNAEEIKGGILADEMGLGKTVEVLALVLLHPAPSEIDGNSKKLPRMNDDEDISDAIRSGSKPESPRQGETNKCPTCLYHTDDENPVDDFIVACDGCSLWYHASCAGMTPSLAEKVAFYCQRCLAPRKRSGALQSSATLIITPTSIMSQWASEIETHAPSLRYFCYQGPEKDGKRISAEELATYDIVLTNYDVLTREIHVARDDNQQMARLIPRVNAWAVTGTPVAKSGLSDLFGLTLFLNFKPLGDSLKLFDFLKTAARRHHLVEAFSLVMHRNSKDSVRDELTLPPQSTLSFFVDFSGIERAYYDDLFETCSEEWKMFMNRIDQLSQTPEPNLRKIREEEERCKAKMRLWFLQLRQTCCHPQVGERNRKALGGTLRSIDDVLEVMHTQTASAVTSTERALIVTKISKAQVFETRFLKEFETSLNIYKSLLPDVARRVSDTLKELDLLQAAKELKKQSQGPDSEVDNEDSEKELNQQTALTQTLHSWRELQHRILFFIASCYHSLKNEDEENNYYEQAADLRSVILKGSESTVKNIQQHTIQVVSAKVTLKLHKLGSWISAHDIPVMGLVARNVLLQLREHANRINGQWNDVLSKWRDRILKLLSADLEPQEKGGVSKTDENFPKDRDELMDSTKNKPTGDEYLKSVDIQTELDELMHDDNKLERDCVICKVEVEIGYLTGCGHLYCKGYWIVPRKSCALCKQRADLSDIKHITYKVRSTSTSGTPKADAMTSCFSRGDIKSKEKMSNDAEEIIRQLLPVKIDGSFGTKVDFIVKHVLMILSSDSQAKCLIFSQWDQVLDIVALGLDKNDIGFVKLEGGGARKRKREDAVRAFKEKTTVKVFILNAKSQSSGLTLVAATHVFLVEPVVHVGLEMQVEEKIHSLSKNRQLALYTASTSERGTSMNEVSMDNNLAVINEPFSSASIKMEKQGFGGGEVVADYDVRWCLFGDKLMQRENINHGSNRSINGRSPQLQGEDEMSAAAPKLATDNDESLAVQDLIDDGDQVLEEERLLSILREENDSSSNGQRMARRGD
ncbi:hypothetical protein HDV05_006719, partial [Chytridiales sp. JEL 0842]